jgi:hypothetical protein
MDEAKAIYSFQRNAVEEVRASVTTFKGREYLDLRVYFKDDRGQWRPTKKGITVNVDLIDELVAAVEALRVAVDATQ